MTRAKPTSPDSEEHSSHSHRRGLKAGAEDLAFNAFEGDASFSNLASNELVSAAPAPLGMAARLSPPPPPPALPSVLQTNVVSPNPASPYTGMVQPLYSGSANP
jgi:hypothetical protein